MTLKNNELLEIHEDASAEDIDAKFIMKNEDRPKRALAL
jgi:hypothetical protein